ncbi:MAG TPA: hypothetical protein DHV38_09925 [Corynebacterium casei]|nr:hypothetical protein [Corynebacterium casei]
MRRSLREGFETEDTTSIMVGETRLPATDEALPEGVQLRRITEEADIRAFSGMADKAYGLDRAGQPD